MSNFQVVYFRACWQEHAGVGGHERIVAPGNRGCNEMGVSCETLMMKKSRISLIFQPHNKTEEACASSVVKVSELRLWWTAYPPRPSQFRLAPHSVCPSVASRESFTRLFFIEVFHLYLKGSRFPIEPPFWCDRFFWQNPVRVARPIPLGRWPSFFILLTSGGSAFSQSRFPSFSSLAAFLFLPTTPNFRSVDSI
jgi:hypothetical protein